MAFLILFSGVCILAVTRKFFEVSCDTNEVKHASRASLMIAAIIKASYKLRLWLVSRKKRGSIRRLQSWTFRDSNPGPIGYEPTALTN